MFRLFLNIWLKISTSEYKIFSNIILLDSFKIISQRKIYDSLIFVSFDWHVFYSTAPLVQIYQELPPVIWFWWSECVKTRSSVPLLQENTGKFMNMRNGPKDNMPVSYWWCDFWTDGFVLRGFLLGQIIQNRITGWLMNNTLKIIWKS